MNTITHSGDEEIEQLRKVNEDQAATIVNLKRALKESEANMDIVCKTIRIINRRESEA